MISLRTLAALAFVAVFVAPPAQAGSVFAKHEMIAAANPYAAKAGLEMLHEGGSAVDAVIAARWCSLWRGRKSSGLGGGAFLVLYDPKAGKVTTFDGRETAPASATSDMFLGPDGKPRPKSQVIPGGLSVGVPGIVSMLEMAHRKYGRLAWAKLFTPAIKLAADGFPVGPKLARTIVEEKDAAQMPDIKHYFYHPNGTPYREGETLKDPALADALRAIAAHGSNAFYRGAIAAAIVNAVRHAPVNPGGMTLADLADYRAIERAPVCGSYRGNRICSMGPPSSGGIAILQVLEMLERFPSSDLQPETLGFVHLFAEANRLAFADRAKYLGDPGFVRVPVQGLLDHAYLAARSQLIDPAHDMGTAQAGTLPNLPYDYAPQRTPQRHGTSHLSVVDAHGEVVSMTTTIESGFGAMVMADGFLLNNELTDFSLEPTVDGKPVADAPEPGKRPMSAMSPAIVFDHDGKFWVAAGSPGGPVIIPYVSKSLSGMIDGGLDPQAATALPHVFNPNAYTMLEQGTSLEALAPKLKAMGHQVVIHSLNSGSQIIQRTKDGYLGGADPRRDGVAIGD